MHRYRLYVADIGLPGARLAKSAKTRQLAERSLVDLVCCFGHSRSECAHGTKRGDADDCRPNLDVSHNFNETSFTLPNSVRQSITCRQVRYCMLPSRTKNITARYHLSAFGETVRMIVIPDVSHVLVYVSERNRTAYCTVPCTLRIHH
jgi:hypothetical protein